MLLLELVRLHEAKISMHQQIADTPPHTAVSGSARAFLEKMVNRAEHEIYSEVLADPDNFGVSSGTTRADLRNGVTVAWWNISVFSNGFLVDVNVDTDDVGGDSRNAREVKFDVTGKKLPEDADIGDRLISIDEDFESTEYTEEEAQEHAKQADEWEKGVKAAMRDDAIRLNSLIAKVTSPLSDLLKMPVSTLFPQGRFDEMMHFNSCIRINLPNGKYAYVTFSGRYNPTANGPRLQLFTVLYPKEDSSSGVPPGQYGGSLGGGLFYLNLDTKPREFAKVVANELKNLTPR